MKINYFNNSIELTTAEAKKASKIGTPEYKELMEAKQLFPELRIVINSKKRKSSYDFKGLTYGFMEEYISKHGTPEQLEEFNEKRFNTEKTQVKADSYGEIKKWFLDAFPAIRAASTTKKLKEIA